MVDHDRRARLRAELILRPLKHPVVLAADAESALGLAAEQQPAVAIIEVELPGLSGLGLLAQLGDRFAGEVPVILTSAEGTTALERATGLLLGADDYLVKPIEPAELVARVRRTLRRSARPRAMGGDRRRRATTTLSPREQQILGYLAEGRTQRQIAADLVISPKTVGTHIQHVLSKLGVHSRAQAVAKAYRSRLVSPGVEAHVLATDASAHAPTAEPLLPPALSG